MDEAAAVTGLVQRLQAGDADAAALLFARYAQQLTRLAEQHLSRKLAGRLDGEDVVQSVFRTFFRRSAGGEFQIDSSAQLWRLLVKITVLKARARARQHSAARRDAAAELPGGDAALVEAVTRQPGPEEAAILVDEIDGLLRGLPPLHCQVLTLRLEGYAVAEIAPRLGVSRQTIYRALDLLQERLTDSAGAEGA
jgi:RNA polymerase sigma-70 factor (ECF subfamily)